MKKLALFLALTGAAFAQNVTIQKTPSTNVLTSASNPIVFGNGQTLTIASGGNFNLASGAVVSLPVGIISWASVDKTGSSLADLQTRSASDLSSGTLPDGRFPATLPAASGVNLTALNASNLASGTVPDARFPSILPALNGSLLTALNATQLTSGTVPDARFPATLPALNGSALTNLNGTAIATGTVSDARIASALTSKTYNGVTLTGASTPSLAVTGTSTVSGTNTGDQTNIPGNAATATALQTARNINGVSFSGTADITVTAAAGTLTGATLASNVLTSSLTSVGTLTNLTVTNPISGSVTGSSGSTSGNAATATALQNARTIGGSNFDGTANVTSFPTPGPIGGTTPSTGAFTTVNGNTITTGTGTLTLGSSTLNAGTGGTLGSAAFTNTTAYAIQVSTIAALKALTVANFTTGSSVNLLGYYAAGDGGGGIFYYDSSSSSTDNGGTIIQPTAGSGRWLRVYSKAVNLRWFGAKGDDSTDDTAALQSAMAIQSPLQIPKGIYRIGLTTFTQTNINWIGELGSVIKLYSQSIYPSNFQAWLFTGSGANIIFDGITFDQGVVPGQNPASGNYDDGADPNTWGGWFLGTINNAANITFRNCQGSGIHRGFLMNSASQGVHLEGCNFQNETTNCQTIFAVNSTINVTSSNNRFVGQRWIDVSANGGVAFYSYSCQKVVITGNQYIGHQVVHRGPPGVISQMVFSGNSVDNPQADTAFFGWTRLTVTGNIIRDSGDMGIGVDGSDFITVTGNVIDSPHIGGIGVNGVIAATVTGNTIRNPARDYTYPQVVANRYASGGGPWLAAIMISFKLGAQGGQDCIVSNNTCIMDVLPPVSDANGPVRAVTYGIYIQGTTGTLSTVSTIGNRVNNIQSDCPLWFVMAGDRYGTYSASMGTPVVGEVFSSPTAWMNMIEGAGGRFHLRNFQGSTFTGDVLVGQTSGATYTVSAAAGGLGTYSNNCIVSGNFDFLTDANYNVYPGQYKFQTTTAPSLPVAKGAGTSFLNNTLYYIAAPGGGTKHSFDAVIEGAAGISLPVSQPLLLGGPTNSVGQYYDSTAGKMYVYNTNGGATLFEINRTTQAGKIYGDFTANNFGGGGAAITSLNASNLSSGQVPLGRLYTTAAAYGITNGASLDTLGALSGTSLQYYRGDKNLATLNQAAVAGLTTSDTPVFANVRIPESGESVWGYNYAGNGVGAYYLGATDEWRLYNRTGGATLLAINRTTKAANFGGSGGDVTAGTYLAQTATDATAGGLGSIVTLGGIYATKTIVGKHFGSTGTAPTIAAGTGAGTSPTVSISGHDAAFTISVTTGTLPTLSATIATVTFNTAYANAPHFSFTPSNSNSSTLNGVNMVTPSSTTTTFVLTAGATALTAATTYTWEVIVVQ